MDQLLQYLAAINGHSNMQLPQMNPDVTPMPRTPYSTLSEDSSPSPVKHHPAMIWKKKKHQMMNESITSATSDRQLRPRVPISYNETVLKCLHGQPQVGTFSNLSIPLPSDSTEEDTDPEIKET